MHLLEAGVDPATITSAAPGPKSESTADAITMGVRVDRCFHRILNQVRLEEDPFPFDGR
jgi:hypothetical protein